MSQSQSQSQFDASSGTNLGFSAAYFLALLPCLFFALTRLQWVYKDHKDSLRSALLITVISLLMVYFIFEIAFSALEGRLTTATQLKALFDLAIVTIIFTFLADFTLAFLLLRGLLAVLHDQDGNVMGAVKAVKGIGFVVIGILGALNFIRMVLYADQYGFSLMEIDAPAGPPADYYMNKASTRNIWAVKVEVAFAWSEWSPGAYPSCIYVFKPGLTDVCVVVWLVYTLAILMGVAVIGIRFRQRDQLTIPLYAATIFTVGARFLMFMILDFLEISASSKLNIAANANNDSAGYADGQVTANIVTGVLSGFFTVLYCMGLVLLGIRKPRSQTASPYPGNANRHTMQEQGWSTDYKQVPTADPTNTQQQQHQPQVVGELPAGSEPQQLPAERTDLLQELGGDTPAQPEEGKSRKKKFGIFSSS